MTETPPEDPILLQLVSEALEMRDRGIEPPIEEICRDRPDLAAAVAASIDVVDRLPGLQRHSADHDVMAHRIIASRYRITARIGAGGMGTVYRATDTKLGRDVAIKVLRSSSLSGREAAARFEREARALAAIQHGSVVTIFDSGVTDADEPCHFLVMELLDGRPLDQLLDDAAKRRSSAEGDPDAAWLQERLNIPEARLQNSYLRQSVRWIADLADGLEAAHAVGVYHRDLKPSNIFLRNDGGAVLIDFGLARLDSSQTLASIEGGILGTPAYLPPESLSGQPTTSPAGDVYSLTATLYHMLTLTAPYRGSPSQVLANLQRSEPVPAFRLRRHMPRDLQAILDKGMDRAPSERYATAAALAADLRAFLEHRDVTARKIGRAARAWRRVRRTPEFRALTWISSIAAALVIAWLVQRSLAQRDAAAWLAEWRHRPLWQQLLPPSMRGFHDVAARDATRARLDKLVELAPTASPSRVVRAAFRLDQGDAVGAASDMDVVATELGTPFARALAHAYSDLVDTAPGTALNLAELPEPQTADDRHLAAFLLIRTSGSRAAEVLQARTWMADHESSNVHAAELALYLDFVAFKQARIADIHARTAAARKLHEAATRLEGTFGTVTATTAMVRGTTLEQQGFREDAIKPLETCIALAPHDATPHINLGLVLDALGRDVEARSRLERAIELRPQSIGAYIALVSTLVDAGAFADAEAAVAATPYPPGPRGDRARASALAVVLFKAALADYRTAPMESAAKAERAVAAFDEARRAGAGESEEEAFCRILAASPTPERVFQQYLHYAGNTAGRWERILNLALLLPESLDSALTERLRHFMIENARQLAPESVPFSAPSVTEPR